MKSKKLTIALTAAFIAALGLSSCTNVQPMGSTVLSLTGYDGKTINLDAQTVYDQFKKGEDGVSSFYKAILEVLIRNKFETSTDESVKAKLVELKGRAQKKVDGVKEEANSKATTNGTNYYDEFSALCENTYHVDDEAGLYQYFLYQLEEEEAKDFYFKDNLDTLTDEYIGFEYDEEAGTWKPVSDSKHDATYPYHIKHILIKLDAAASDYATGEISSENASKLTTVYQALAKGTSTFGEVAGNWSDDGSKSEYGDAGIMSTSTTFVKEFKLGTYAFDALYNTLDGDSSLTKSNYFGLNKQYRDEVDGSAQPVSMADKMNEFGLRKVNFAVFNRFEACKDEQTSEDGLTVNDGAVKYYPRNIYFNQFLNDHAPFIIVDDGTDLGDGVAYADEDKPTLLTQPGKAGFREVFVDGAVRKVLTDELGRIIFCVRSEFGIHFLVAQRTPFETDGTIIGYTSDPSTGIKYNYNGVPVNDYYTTLTPTDDNYPTDSKTGEKAVTYVNFYKAEDKVLIERADKVKTAVKGFDTLYDYRLFEELEANGQIKIHDANIKKEIDSYIANKRSYNKYNDDATQKSTWEAYIDLLQNQKTIQELEWTDVNDGAKMHRRVNLVCARHFKNYDPSNSIWKKGGACYYAK